MRKKFMENKAKKKFLRKKEKKIKIKMLNKIWYWHASLSLISYLCPHCIKYLFSLFYGGKKLKPTKDQLFSFIIDGRSCLLDMCLKFRKIRGKITHRHTWKHKITVIKPTN